MEQIIENEVQPIPAECMREYAEITTAITNAKAGMRELLEAVKNTEEYKTLQEFVEAEQQNANTLEAALKNRAVEQFRHDGNKKPWNGMTIKEMTKISYDQPLALVYCKERLPDAVLETIDKKLFEDSIKSLKKNGRNTPDWVRITTEPEAQLSSNLSMWLLDH